MYIYSNIIRHFLLIYSIANIQIDVCLDFITVILSHDSLSDNKINYCRVFVAARHANVALLNQGLYLKFCPVQFPLGPLEFEAGPFMLDKV